MRQEGALSGVDGQVAKIGEAPIEGVGARLEFLAETGVAHESVVGVNSYPKAQFMQEPDRVCVYGVGRSGVDVGTWTQLQRNAAVVHVCS